MIEKLRKILFREENKSDLDPGIKTSESHLIIHKTTSAQRCEVCHQSDLFNAQTGECGRCGNIPINYHPQVTNINNTEPNPNTTTRNRLTLMGFITVLAVGSFLYKLIVLGRLDQTAILFIGLPAILAILASFIPKQKTFTGTILKGLTLSLLMAATFSAAFLGEGVICIFMAAPLFYVVGIVIGVILDIINRNPEDRPNRNKGPLTAIIFIPFLIMSLEGVTSNFSFSRDETITVEKIVLGNSQAVEKALAHIPQFTTKLPFYLTLQFPRPEVAHGSGLAIGDKRTILFAGGEGKPGLLILTVASAKPGHVVFKAISDKSEIGHWLTWQESLVEWQEIDSQHTKVTWTIKYKRGLDPSWYFGPWERYAVGLSAEYLIDNLATPRQK